MALPQVVLEKFRELDNATNEVAEDLVRLRAQVTAGMSDAAVAEVQNQLDAKIARLRTLAEDPENPVPTPE